MQASTTMATNIINNFRCKCRENIFLNKNDFLLRRINRLSTMGKRNVRILSHAEDNVKEQHNSNSVLSIAFMEIYYKLIKLLT